MKKSKIQNFTSEKFFCTFFVYALDQIKHASSFLSWVILQNIMSNLDQMFKEFHLQHFLRLYSWSGSLRNFSAFYIILIFFWFWANLSPKNHEIWYFLVKNYHKIRKNQNFQKILFESLLNHPKTIWCKFQPIWTKTVTPEKFLVKNQHKSEKIKIFKKASLNLF